MVFPPDDVAQTLANIYLQEAETIVDIIVAPSRRIIHSSLYWNTDDGESTIRVLGNAVTDGVVGICCMMTHVVPLPGYVDLGLPHSFVGEVS